MSGWFQMPESMSQAVSDLQTSVESVRQSVSEQVSAALIEEENTTGESSSAANAAMEAQGGDQAALMKTMQEQLEAQRRTMSFGDLQCIQPFEATQVTYW